MTGPLFRGDTHWSETERGLEALRADLVHADGPQISQMRSYRFALLPYDPSHEFRLRRAVHALAADLRAAGWIVGTLDLTALLHARIDALGPDRIERLVAMERRISERDPNRALEHIQSRIAGAIEGPDGLAADVAARIRALVSDHPERAGRTVAFLGRLGGLYPFSRASALLKYLDGHTADVPVIVLYPGSRAGDHGLSFMGRIAPDRDYRPRIYP